MRVDDYVRRVWGPALDVRDGVRPRTADEYRKVAASRVVPVRGHRRLSELRSVDATRRYCSPSCVSTASNQGIR